MQLGFEAYVKGTKNIKDTVRVHNASKLHQDAVNAMKHLAKMDDETFKRICRLFDWAYTIAHSELPFTNFETFISVEKKHGVKLGSTHANDKACQKFIDETGETMADDLKCLFTMEPFYCCILFDVAQTNPCQKKKSSV